MRVLLIVTHPHIQLYFKARNESHANAPTNLISCLNTVYRHSEYIFLSRTIERNRKQDAVTALCSGKLSVMQSWTDDSSKMEKNVEIFQLDHQ
jgi:hypothetical protein